MGDNVINLELEYFKRKNDEAYNMLIKKEFKKVIEHLKEPLEKIEVKLTGQKVYCPQNIFEATIFLNLLEPKATEEDFGNINYYDFYLINASANYNLGQYEEARKYYEKAIEINPSSAVARLQKMEIDKTEKKFDNFVEDIKEFFKYAYRRTEMARAYRNVGYYLYEKKDYEMAIVAYFLSNAYEVTETAINEAGTIAETAEIDLDSKQWLSEELLGELYEKYKIPLLPNPDLVMLANVVSDDAYNKEALISARFLYQVAYELTLEEEKLQKIEELNEKITKMKR